MAKSNFQDMLYERFEKRLCAFAKWLGVSKSKPDLNDLLRCALSDPEGERAIAPLQDLEGTTRHSTMHFGVCMNQRANLL